jgi:hypothetical protein
MGVAVLGELAATSAVTVRADEEIKPISERHIHLTYSLCAERTNAISEIEGLLGKPPKLPLNCYDLGKTFALRAVSVDSEGLSRVT